jgi:glutathione S-transferase
MSLELYFHPLASFCQKALIAFYENDTPFEPHIVDLGDATSSAEFKKIWPIGKFPVLRDAAKNRTIPESSVIIEYLDLHYPGRTRLVSADVELAWQTRLRDRFYDLYVHEPMQKVVGDRLRPAGSKDPHGVTQARALLATAYDIDGVEDLGHGGRLQHGRLRRRAGAVLRQPGDAVRRHPQERGGLLRPSDGASVLRAGG